MVIGIVVALALIAILEWGNRRDNKWFWGDDE
jgi:hypothetical protein